MVSWDLPGYGLGAGQESNSQDNSIRYALAQVRRRAGLSQCEAAKALGVTLCSWNRWETGRHVPSVSFIWRIANYFDEDAAWLLISRDSTIRRMTP
jgi:transcriptional regulator with XRE-family HTH domain